MCSSDLTGMLRSDVLPEQVVPMFDPIIAGSWIAIHKGADPALIEYLTQLAGQSADLARD